VEDEEVLFELKDAESDWELVVWLRSISLPGLFGLVETDYEPAFTYWY